MIEVLVSALDRLVKLTEYRNKAFQDRFAKLIEPTFNDLLTIHGDYLKMFHDAHMMLLQNSTKDANRIPETIDYLKRRRNEFEPVRVKLRQFANLLPDTSSNDQESQFFVAVREYFPDGCLRHRSTAATELIDRLNYFDDSLETPTDIAEANFSGTVAYIRDVIERSRTKWSEVCVAYGPLRLKAAKN